MPATLSLTYPAYHSGVVRRDSSEWVTIFRSATFKTIAEVATVSSLFLAIAVWMFVLPTL